MSRLLCRTFFTASRLLHKDFVSKVPGMGDSITEGSLIKLVAKLGALVKQDEIVAVIETDKVRAWRKAATGGRQRVGCGTAAHSHVSPLPPCLTPTLSCARTHARNARTHPPNHTR